MKSTGSALRESWRVFFWGDDSLGFRDYLLIVIFLKVSKDIRSILVYLFF